MPPNAGQSSWTIDTVREYASHMITVVEKRLDEHNSDLEKRLMDRIHANREATVATMEASKEAVFSAMVAAKEAVQAALVSAKEAVNKAESANERRFESVNEFRASLADKARLQMPRLECEALFKGMGEKMETSSKQTIARVDLLSQQSIANAGKKAGIADGWGFAIGAVGLVLAVVSIVAFLFRIKG